MSIVNINNVVGNKLSDYNCERMLGRGTFSKVYHGNSVVKRGGYPDNQPNSVAIKVYRTGRENRLVYEQEISILTYLKNALESKPKSAQDHILVHLDTFAVIHNDGELNPYITPIPCISFPLLGEDLYKIMKDLGAGFPLTDAKNIIKQISHGVHYLHECNIIHTDLKPENVLLTTPAEMTDNSNIKVKICDLGSAAIADDIDTGTIGTYGYISPEAMLRIGYSFPTDIWSVGCLVFELLTGDPFFSNFDDDDDSEESYEESYDDSMSESSDGTNETDEQEDFYQMFILYEEFFGRIPKKMARKKKDNPYFNTKGVIKNNPTIVEKSISETLIKFYEFHVNDAKYIEQFIKYIMKYEPNERPSAFEVMTSKFLN